jgi:predicted dehydrogenase
MSPPGYPVSRRNVLKLGTASLGAMALGENPVRAADGEKRIRVGFVGIDNYQAVEFAKFLNDPHATGELTGFQAVSAYPGGSPDLAESRDNLPKWVQQIQQFGVKIVDSIPEVIKHVDAVIIMSLDGRTHLDLARPVIEAHKPLYIGRPLAAQMVDAVRIYDLAARKKLPIFSCSQHRFSPGFYDMRNHPEVGKVLGCEVHGGCPLDPSHADLFWHGVHGVETLYTIMGPGCESVTRVQTPVTEFVTGTWKDGRVGTFRGIHQGAIGYQALVYGSDGIVMSGKYGGYAPVKGVYPEGKYAGYEPLARQIAQFFKTGKPPVSPEETLELFAFMEAAHESKRRGGAPVALESTLAAARQAAKAKA